MFEIKKLTPELIDTFINFLENLEFKHAPQWKGCYCHYYHSEVPSESWRYQKAEDNKLKSIQAIYEGMMTGFLAFHEGKCIGWANINDARRYKRLEEELKKYIQDKRVALSICFIISPEFRNQGVARKLLDHAIEYYRYQGFDGMIAMPSNGDYKKELHYHGTMNMYLERGYKEIDKIENTKIMYKQI